MTNARLSWLAIGLAAACAPQTGYPATEAPLAEAPAGPAFRARGPFYGRFQGAYLWDHDDCTEWNDFVYYEPAASGPFPIAVFVPGTTTYPDDPLPHLYLRMLAERGYLAVTMDYGQNHWNCAFGCFCYSSKADCAFDPGRENSLVSILDRTTSADSALGMVVWGHSQGGYLAVMAGNRNPHAVRALATGTGNPSRLYDECMLPGARGLASDQLRFVIGEQDEVTGGQVEDDGGDPGIRRQLAELTERPDCLESGAFSCLAEDGGGFYIVRGSELEDGAADHRFFFDAGDGGSDLRRLDERYVGDPTAAWGLEASVAWVTGS